MDDWEEMPIPDSKMRKLISNCAALKPEPELVHNTFVYTEGGEYSQIWTKEDVHDDEPIYYYYKIKILGLYNKENDEKGEFLFVQNWGAFDTINHRKRIDSLPLRLCQQKFVIQSSERSRNFMFARIKENNISKNALSEPVQELIVKYIFEIDFLKKMIDEYTFDIKNTISKLIKITEELPSIKSQVTYPGQRFSQLGKEGMESWIRSVRELLDEVITCEPTDKINGISRTFSLMNFYYKQLHTTINVLNEDSERYKIIEKYFKNSQSSQHQSYTNMKLKSVFEIERPCDNHRYTKDLKNKRLLWHGTSTCNIPSILYEGFRTTKANRGGMFGPGTYFANSVSKSVAYCRASNEAVILLCEVALGDIMQCYNACQPLNSNGLLPGGKNSVHGVGILSPNIYDSVTIDNDVLVPYGQLQSSASRGGLQHDEFIVYNPSQIKMRYLITTGFCDSPLDGALRSEKEEMERRKDKQKLTKRKENNIRAGNVEQ